MKNVFTTIPLTSNHRLIVRIPTEISRRFSSRGLVFARVSCLGTSMDLPLEPDGTGSHWFECSSLVSHENLLDQPLTFELDTDIPWAPPEVPDDFLQALEAHGLMATWNNITVKAKWEWVRWIRSTANPNTRAERLKVACDKLTKGLKRPCCFDQTKCTVPELSRNGKLVVGE